MKKLSAACVLLLAVLGPILISYGVFSVSKPAGLVVGGLSCVWLEFRSDSRKGD
jgi:hypothetical protein